MVDLLVPTLLLLGFLSIVLNTLVGGGGGTVLVPALILIFNQSASTSIATSFVAVTVGAVVSTFAYIRQGRVDYRAGLVLAALTLPGTILGPFITNSLQGPSFQLVLGIVIILAALLPLTTRQFRPIIGREFSEAQPKGGWSRRFTDAFGTNFSYRISMRVAIPSALVTGFLSGTFGGAGGLVLTPGMVFAGFPVHIALGTVRLVAVVLSLGGALTRLYLGQVDLMPAVWLSVGAVFGAFAGARLARVINSDLLSKVVSVGIFLLGLTLVLKTIL